MKAETKSNPDQIKVYSPQEMLEQFAILPEAVLTDVDGTLLDDQKLLTKKSKQVIRDSAAVAYPFALSTGRHYATLRKTVLPIFAELAPKRLHISSGGAAIIDSLGHTLYEKALASDLVREICHKILELGGNFAFGQGEILYVSQEMYEERRRIISDALVDYRLVDGLKDWQAQIVVISSENERIIEYMRSLADQMTVKRLPSATGRKYYYDITALGVNKGETAKVWAEMQRIDLARVAAIGDSANDLELLRAAGVGIAVRNANTDVLQTADLVLSLSNQENAVAELVAAILKKKGGVSAS